MKTTLCPLLAALAALPTPPPRLTGGDKAVPFLEGIVVEEVRKEFPGGQAGLQPGDVLLSWSSEARRPDQAAPTDGRFGSPFDLVEVGLEWLPRGSVTLLGVRDGAPFAVRAPPEADGFGIRARPPFAGGLLERYEKGRDLIARGSLDEGVAAWREVAAAAQDAGARCWMLGRIGSELGKARRFEVSRAAYREAVACAEPLGHARVAALYEDHGATELAQGEHAAAEEVYLKALDLRRRGTSRLAEATCMRWLGVAELRHSIDHGIRRARQALALFEAEAPGSIAVAWTHLSLAGGEAAKSGSDAGGEELLLAVRMAEAAAPNGATVAGAYLTQGHLAYERGELAVAARHYERAWEAYRRLDPQSGSTAKAELNLGNVAAERGDLDAAEVWYRRALSTTATTDEARLLRPNALLGLGGVARDRGELASAEDLLRRAVREFEEPVRRRYYLAMGSLDLGHALRLRGNRKAAKPLFEQALALCDEMGVHNNTRANALTALGDLAREEGEWNAAQDFYGRALALRERVSPSSTGLAQVLHGLAAVQRAQGHIEEAAQYLTRAVDTLEAQRWRVATSDEGRSLFASAFFGIYHDQIDLLVRAGRVREAFGVLETSRARSLLALMAERDLVFRDVPPELERERRRAGTAYERVKASLGRLDPGKDAPEIERLTFRLRQLRDRQDEIADEIRETSPRLADLRDPRPLDADGVRANLEPGTAFLAYSVGTNRTILFVLTPGPDAGANSVQAFTIPIGKTELGERIDRWRRLAERTVPPAEFFTEGRALYDLLFRPAEPRLRSARRLLISQDGPLHRLPFGALRRGQTYLVEWKPLSVVPSGTIHAQVVRSRNSVEHAVDFEAFGAPRAAGLEPLPATRHEVEAIARLFPKTAVHLGDEATEERVKALGGRARYVHFASHGLIDERFPLDSALVLSDPETADGEHDNGRLQAWEIFERVRLDADLVTLSACRSAAGPGLSGEGLIGLTRAFHYAGARSVLASLWNVGDKSTFELMNGVYRGLKSGLPKDEALRRAQVQAIRRGRHPVRWAAFQLYGDWR